MEFGTPFCIEEVVEANGVVRLALAGELDLSTRAALKHRLHELTSRRVAVCLDLSRLEFMDAGGLEVLVGAVAEARRRASGLELDPRLTPQVSRMLAFADAELF